ncbi:MAG: hypothetical protein RR343_05025 [Oscillospiraceae bacterium]
MYNFILLQHQLYVDGKSSIGIDKINALCDKWLTKEQKAVILGGGKNVV